MNTAKGSDIGNNIPAGANGPAGPNDWSVEKDESGFTIKYDSNEMYQIYEELYETINDFVHKRIEHLPEEEQLGVIDLLSDLFRFKYPEDKDVVED